MKLIVREFGVFWALANVLGCNPSQTAPGPGVHRGLGLTYRSTPGGIFPPLHPQIGWGFRAVAHKNSQNDLTAWAQGDTGGCQHVLWARVERDIPARRHLLGQSCWGQRQLLGRCGLVSPLMCGSGAAAHVHGRTGLKTGCGMWGHKKNFFPAAAQHHILPSPAPREPTSAPVLQEGPRASSGLLTRNPFRRDFNSCKWVFLICYTGLYLYYHLICF